MFEKGEDVIISGQVFPYNLFMYLLTRFKEAFCLSSLSVEEAFRSLAEFDFIINSSKDKTAYEYFWTLPEDEQKNITSILHQIIVYKGSLYGAFPDTLSGDPIQFEDLYQKYFSYFDDYIHFFLVFDQNGNFDKRETFHKLETLFINLPQRQTAYTKAYNMNKDHMDACDFAIEKKTLTIGDTIMINNIVNDSDENKVLGYKKVDNVVVGADFETTSRKDVPVEMQKLYYEYEQNFGMTLKDPNEPGIPGKEKYDRTCDIFRKEALFHIRFIHIHPFADGNGRTGRIVLNHHLLSQGIAPLLISDVMSEEYKRCINDSDVEGLARLLFYSSSLQVANWVSFKKAHLKIHKKDIGGNNSEMAEIDEFGATGAAQKKHLP